ncbi:aldo/keto reductase [Nocardia pseudobrasiliensis]|uniref:Aryl-alcohol dehydrogenase-like predicted oxidoreductase n=1 Tax=Nocardia pseudobrasiliensis TaxID=45979 RepID=A0A370I5Y0_9NOCA|nr:aldo/keto reductase [Nocardia pseudobrasiliensis]RDI64724.1 aryl-alcohol dehydrogenase-like predicted oxidoreductase [Nocardia pseudobrasiliensis]
MAKIGITDLDVFPLCLGGNVFGWTADRAESFDVLDAFVAGGGNFIDTADVYSAWVPGNSGGESETILGEWIQARDNRDRLVLATKGSRLAPFEGLSAKAIRGAVEASLRRLRTDHIDLYYAHYDDPATPLEETVAAYDELIRAGKLRYVAASNVSPDRIRASLAFADREGLARYVAIQPQYNLVERTDFERDLLPLAQSENLATIPYYALAKGFLTGKYRPGKEVDSPRAEGAATHLNARGLRVLEVLDAVAATHDVPVAAISLAWLAAQPTIAAPIASARNTTQLAGLLPVGELRLSDDELNRLTAASE